MIRPPHWKLANRDLMRFEGSREPTAKLAEARTVPSLPRRTGQSRPWPRTAYEQPTGQALLASLQALEPLRAAQIYPMVPHAVIEHLERHRLPYTLYPHVEAHSPRAFALALNLPGYRAVHTVAFRADDELLLAVYDASSSLDIEAVLRAVRVDKLVLAEASFDLFRGCALEALPPLSTLFGGQTLMDAELAHGSDFILRGGTVEDAIEVKAADWLALENPLLANISSPLARPQSLAGAEETWLSL